MSTHKKVQKAKDARRVGVGAGKAGGGSKCKITEKKFSSQNGEFIFAHRTPERRALGQLAKEVDAEIKKCGGPANAPVELVEIAIDALKKLQFLTEGMVKEELQAQAYMGRNPFLMRRIVNVGSELHILLNADFKQAVRASELLRSLHYVSRNPNWLDGTTTFFANRAKGYGSKPSAKQIEEFRGLVRDTKDNVLAFDLASIGHELGKLICDAVTQNSQAVPSFFESLATIWKGLGDDVALYEPLAGRAREKHRRMFALVRCAKMPPSEDASSPTAKLWPSRDEFVGWLKQHDLHVSKSWLSGLLIDDVPAWPTREELKQWLSDKLGITNPTEAVLSEYWDKHNNAMPSLSSLIGNAKGKKPKGKQVKR